MPKSPRVESQWKAERERLASELYQLEEALSDARDGTAGGREGAPGEEDGSLVARLREATRKRVRIEEEFERSSDRWRDERRNLNAEIDRLDRALQKAQTEARRSRSTESVNDTKLQAELRETTRHRDELDETLQAERNQWESERHNMEARIADLESGLVDAIERANNAAQADQSRDGALRTEMEAQRQKLEIEVRAQFQSRIEKLERTVQDLEQERGQLHLEIHRLNSATPAPARAATPSPAPDTGRLSLKDRLRGRLRGGEEPEPAAAAAAEADDGQLAELQGALERETARAEEATRRYEAAEARISELSSELSAGASGDADSVQRLESELDSRTRAWEAERAALDAKIGELEASLSEAGTAEELQAKTGELEAELAAARESQSGAEGATRELEDRIGTLEGERETLEARVRELETSLGEAQAAGQSGAEAAQEIGIRLAEAEERARALEESRTGETSAWSTEREELFAQVADLESAVGQAQAARTDLDQQLEQLQAEFEEARREAKELRDQANRDAQNWGEERASLRGQIEELQTVLREARQADASSDDRSQKLVSDLEAAEARLAAAAEAWQEERTQLGAALEAESTRVRELEAAVSNSAGDTGQREALEVELEARTRSWEAERAGLEEQLAEANRELGELRNAEVKGKAASTGESAARRGIASFGRVLSSLGGGNSERDGDTSVADLEARRQALEVRLQESEDAREELATRLQAASEDWDEERVKLEAQMAEMNKAGATASEKEKADLEAQHRDLLSRLKEAEERYTNLEETSMSSARAWDEQRSELEHEIAQWEQQVAAEAERVAEETRKALAEEYDKQLRELQKEKEDLQAQLSVPGGGAGLALGGAVDPEAVVGEIARVDGEIDEINRLIEDPNAALSNVMRKNAERSELKAYRRGLAYLAERVSREQETPDA